jgi:hypothetical protein
MKAWSWTALTRLATMSAVLVQLGCTEDPVVPPSSELYPQSDSPRPDVTSTSSAPEPSHSELSPQKDT